MRVRPARRRPDPYATLGVEPGASAAEIRRAYRRRALEVHPDVAGSDTTDEMADLNAARDRLLAEASEQGTGAKPSSPPRAAHPEAPSYDHSPTWDDYWAAWNDPPRRPR